MSTDRTSVYQVDNTEAAIEMMNTGTYLYTLDLDRKSGHVRKAHPSTAGVARVVRTGRSFPLWSHWQCHLWFSKLLLEVQLHVVPREVKRVKRKIHVQSGIWLVQPSRIQ